LEIALFVAGLSLVSGLTQMGVSHLLARRREKEAAARAAALAREAEERRAKTEREAALRGQIQVASFAEVREFANPPGDAVYPPARGQREVFRTEASYSRPIGAYLVVAGLLILLGVGVSLAIEALL
jgi:hypothetical protein